MKDLSKELEKLERQINGIDGAGIKKIQKRYAKALDDLRDTVRKNYDKYGKEGKLTYAELAKYDRIKKLNKELAETLRDMHVETSKITRSILRDTYKTSFNGLRNAVENVVGKTIRGTIKREVINDALQMPVSGLKLNDRLRRNRRLIISQIQETIGQGLYQGESYTSMSKRLKNSLEGDVVKAKRIVRTESHRVMEKSKMDSAQHAVNQGVDMRKYWLSSEDENVRTSHGYMASKYDIDNAIPIDQNFVNGLTGGEGPAPGMLGTAKDDINCRCISVTVVDTGD